MEYSTFLKCDSGTGILNRYKLSELLDKFIIQRDDNRSFTILDNLHSYIEYQSTFPQPMFHELILNAKPRKFFLDLDFKVAIANRDDYQKRLKRYEKHIDGIKDVIISVFNSTYIGKSISKTDILEVVSHKDIDSYLNDSSPEKSLYKFSMNLIINKYLFANQTEFAQFGNAVIAKYKSALGSENKIIDEKFYKNSNATFIQNRIIYSTKFGETRYKCPRINGRIVCDRSINMFQEYVLQQTTKTLTVLELRFDQVISLFRQIKSGTITDEFIKDVLAKTEHVWKREFVPRRYDGSKPVLYFDRIPGTVTYCEFCDDTHSKDGNLFYYITEDKNVYAKCLQKRNGAKLIYSPDWYEVIPIRIAQPQLVDKPNITPVVDVKSLEWFTPLKDIGARIHIETEDKITNNAFTGDEFVLIKAEMKMGKSKALIKYITENDSNFTKVIFISFRRTFSAEARKKYSGLGFKSYNDIDGAIDLNINNRIIIQVESLSRLKLPIQDIDLVILDEMESIWSQISSNNFRDFYGSYNVFEMLLRIANKVIAMDANLSIRTSRIFTRICNEMPSKHVSVYINRYNPNRDITFYTIEKGAWLAKIDSVAKSSNIAIFSNSLKEARVLKMFLAQYIPPKSIKLYGSKTKESTKQKHFNNVNEYWSQYRCVICTPTVSAGVSFEKSHFDYVFGYFTDKSCNVETCRQMLGRVREIKSKEVYITLSTSCDGKYLTDLREIKLALARNRTELVKQYDSNLSLLNFRIDNATGHCSYEDNLQLNIILENIAFDNRSRNKFASLMTKQLTGEYNKLDIKSRLENSINCNRAIVDAIKAKYRNITQQTKKTLIENVSNAENLNEESYAELIEKSRNMCDITKSEHNAIEKYNIQRITKLDFDDIKGDIVKVFSKKHKQQALIANRLIFSRETWEKSIEAINEGDKYRYENISNRSKESIMFKGKVHSLIYNICKGFTYHNSTGIDILFIAKSRFGLSFIGNNFNANELYGNIVSLMPMIDIPYNSYFYIGGIGTELSINSFIMMVTKILNTVYGFRYKTTIDSVYLLPMKDIIYIHNEDKYLNGKELTSEEIAYPVVNITYLT